MNTGKGFSMEKNAQKRNIFDKLHESANISGIATEKFNPKFVKIMDELRNDIDDPIRAIISGEKNGNAYPPDGILSTKAYLKNAKDYLSKREYMNALGYIGKFHRSMEMVVELLLKFKGNVDEVHEEFLKKDVSDETREELARLQGLFSKKKSANNNSDVLNKYAGVMDFLLGKERGMITWEKLYPKQFKKLREDLTNLLRESNSLQSITLSSLKDMASYRAGRKVNDYIITGELIIKSYRKYDTSFDTFFQAHHLLIDKIVKSSTPKDNPVKTEYDQSYPKYDDFVSELSDDALKNKPLRTTQPMPLSESPMEESVTEPVIELGEPYRPKHITVNQGPLPSAMELTPMPNPNEEKAKLKNAETIKRLEKKIKEQALAVAQAKESEKSDKEKALALSIDSLKKYKLNQKAIRDLSSVNKPKPPTVGSYNKFLITLEKLSGEHPLILANFISKYASTIQHDDYETAIKLFKIVKNIRG
jgi:hypothetical protein